MASGRRSSDPTDLLLVDPSQPEATQRARKHLTKRQKDIFIQYGFSKALLREVIAAGWDQVASGRHSSDPTDLLLVDPSQPEATQRARKHLTKRQKDIFIQYGFSKALLREVIAAGWDQVDIIIMSSTTIAKWKQN